MAAVDFLGKGWAFPVAARRGVVASSEADQLIRESIMIILGTGRGERVMRPDFGCGLNELVFSPVDSSTATLVSFYVKDALQRWEPRIDVLGIGVSPDAESTNRLVISIDYRIKTTNSKHNLVYPFYLEARK